MRRIMLKVLLGITCCVGTITFNKSICFAKDSAYYEDIEVYLSSIPESEEDLSKFSLKRLNVISKSLSETYGAIAAKDCFGEVQVLQYATKEDTKYAYSQLSKYYEVYIDEVIELEEEKYDTSVDYYMNNEYTVNQMRLNVAQDNTKDLEKQVKIAVLDSGGFNTKYNTERFYKNTNVGIVPKRDEKGNRVYDEEGNELTEEISIDYNIGNNSHGTEVSGIILDNTSSNVELGFYMLNFYYTYLNYNEETNETEEVVSSCSTVSNLINQINCIINDGCDVVNMSAGILTKTVNNPEPIVSAFESLYNNDIPLVVSAGNNISSLDLYYPQCLSTSIVVGSINANKTKSNFSPTGNIDFVSYGENVSILSDNYDLGSGTSFSAPFITSFIAELMLMNDYETVPDIEKAVQYYCQDLGDEGYDNSYGWGLPVYYTRLEECTVLGRHDYSNWVITVPTCTEVGKKDRVCTICNKKEEIVLSNPIGHDFEVNIVKPTCITNGYTNKKCKNCDYAVEGTDIVKPTGHKEIVIVNTDSNCVEHGHYTVKCGYCNELLRDYDKELSDKLHKGPVKDTYSQGTCIEPTTIVSTCTACGKVVEETYFGYNSHKYVYTKTEGSKEIYTCTVCGNIKEEDVETTTEEKATTEKMSTTSTKQEQTQTSTQQEKTTEVTTENSTSVKSEKPISISKYSWSGLKIVQSKKSKKYKRISVKGNLKGYSYVQIKYSTNKSMKGYKKVTKLLKGVGKNRTYILGNLKRKKTYYVKVRYCSKLSGKCYYGAWSSKKKIKIK